MTKTVVVMFFGMVKEVTTDKTDFIDGTIVETHERTSYFFGIPFSKYIRTEERTKGLKDVFNGVFNGTIIEEE